MGIMAVALAWMFASAPPPIREQVALVPAESAPERAAEVAAVQLPRPIPAGARQPLTVAEVPDPLEGPLAAAPEELEDVTWVEGRVLLPEGVPDDEEIWIEGRARAFEDGSYHRVQAEADGSFRLAFPGGKYASVVLEARYLYLETSARITLAEPPADFVLEPVLGGRIEGEITWHRTCGWVREAAEGATVRFGRSYSTTAGQDLRFELNAVSAEPGDLVVHAETLMKERLPGLRVEPGVTRFVSIELQKGVTISGRVVDEDGEGIAKAFVGYRHDFDSFGYSNGARTDEEGTFVLSGLAPGELAVFSDAAGYRRCEVEVGEQLDGAVVGGVVLRAPRGLALAGSVRWPDGRPVEGATVVVKNEDGSNEGVLRTNEEGQFELAGLGDESYAVEASARRDGSRWRAWRDGLRAPQHGLTLTLGEGASIAGRVVDAKGEPIDAFRVSMASVEEGSIDGWDTTTGRSFRDKDGEFLLRGLGPGAWRMTVDAEGYGATDVAVRLPGAADVQVVLLPAARIGGLVLAPDGTPVAHARILLGVREARTRVMTLVDTGGPVFAGADGRFELPDVTPGTYEVRASLDTHVDSPSVPVRVHAGEVREGLVLRLRPGCAITGRLDDSVEDRIGRTIWVAGETSEIAQTDEHGGFRFEGLPAGEYELRLLQFGGGRNQQVPVDGRFSVDLELSEGEHAQVVLGTPPPVTTWVSGRVLRDGVPVAGHHVSCGSRVAEGGGTKADGTFRLGLDRTGPCTFRFGDNSEAYSQVVDVPDQAEVELYFHLPSGAILVTVTDASGRPLDRATISSRRLPPTGTRRYSTSDSEGRVRLGSLESGEYELHAIPEGRFDEFHRVVAEPGKVVVLTEADRLLEVVLVCD